MDRSNEKNEAQSHKIFDECMLAKDPFLIVSPQRGCNASSLDFFLILLTTCIIKNSLLSISNLWPCKGFVIESISSSIKSLFMLEK